MTYRIAIDVTSCAYAPMSGTGVYVRNVVSELLKLKSNVEYHLISSKSCDLSWAEGTIKWFGEGELSKHNILWWAMKGNKLISDIDADVFWSPFQFFPVGLSKKRRTVLTVHDLVWYHIPSSMDRRNYLMNRTMMKKSIMRASSIMTVSNATRDDLLGHFDVDEKKIYPVYHAASCVFGLADDAQLKEFLGRYPICGEPYILVIGSIEPRKNHLSIVKAIEKLRMSNTLRCNLIIAGSFGWRNSEFFDYLNKSDMKDHVHILRNVDQTDLVSLYNMALLLAFPSLMEGFGIPILEAMACGCPVVTSNRSSMPEVAGNAAIFVNPYDLDSIANGILEAMNRREELKCLGLGRVKKFSWRESANKHLNVFIRG